MGGPEDDQGGSALVSDPIEFARWARRQNCHRLDLVQAGERLLRFSAQALGLLSHLGRVGADVGLQRGRGDHRHGHDR